MTREMKQIFTRRITQANRTQLVVILYDMVLEYLKEAIAAQEIDCIQEYKKAMQCARNCISELRNSLDFNYEISKNLFAIYAFADRELASEMHSIKKDALSQIAGMFQKLRDAYYTISKEDHSQPLMQNAQNVYAGYTYGRTDVNESLYSGAARGYCV
ncbi:flagellar protein FliS [Lachnospiraceae bacterium A4]|jgi:flagellar protein FliS|nr:flagellar protein FliS [Lachnospiraceae bacterium A4]